jgi:FkbM family methyltransferase
MLFDFDQLVRRWKIKPEGVLHIGASEGQEAEAYLRNGIKKQIWIEAIPEVYEKLKVNLKSNPDAKAINACISDRDGETVTFHIASNGGQSSSMLEFDTHSKVHPDVTFVKDITLITERIDSIFSAHNFTGDWLLNIDLQGAELKALQGMGNLLKSFKWAYIEVNKAHLYKDCPLIGDIDGYMGNFGFTRVDVKWCGSFQWGDAIYIRQ